MKKRMIALMLGMTMVFTMAGCGDSKGESTESSSTESGSTESSTEDGATESSEESTVSSIQMGLEPADYVTELCDYSVIPVSLSSYYEASEENIQETMESVLSSYSLNVKEVTDRTTTQAGDYVNVDYTGYQDGEAFSGGSATDVLLDISNNMTVGGSSGFITGFCDGLFGVEVGSTVDCDVTFPEDYGVDSLNGQTVTFEFVINGIYEECAMDEIEDSVIAENFESSYGVTTLEELREFVQEYLEYYRDSAIVSEIKSYVIENSTFELPEDYMAARLKEYEATFEELYCDDGQTFEEYFQTNYSMELADAEEEITSYLEEQVKTEFAFSVIADQLGIEFDEDEYAEYVANLLSNSSSYFSDEDTMYSCYGAGSVEDGQTYLREQYLINKAIDAVADSAVVTYTADEE